jgi:hypothetical protein
MDGAGASRGASRPRPRDAYAYPSLEGDACPTQHLDVEVGSPGPLGHLRAPDGARDEGDDGCPRAAGAEQRVDCDALGFQLGLLTLMIRSTELTLVKRRSAWAITSKTSPATPNGTPWSTHGQGLVKTLVKPLKHSLTPMSPGTFAAFSKFHLNTSNSPNTKVMYFVEGHNFHIEWHCWFEVQIGEKYRSTPLGTIH